MDVSQLILQFSSDFYISPKNSENFLERVSRESTTLIEYEGYETKVWHSLGFNQPPRNAQSGYVFGIDPAKCDFVLKSTVDGRRNGVAGQHFSITFNDDGLLVLRDFSSCGSAVAQNGQDEGQFRRNFLWILCEKDISVTIRRYVGDELPVTIKIRIPDRSSCQQTFSTYVQQYLCSSKQALPLGLMAIQSLAISAYPSCPQTPGRQAPIYHKISNIGRGGYGIVEKVMDVSTGKIFALKKFGLKADFQVEFDILSSITHDYIVPFIDHQLIPDPCLVMDYLPLGNVHQQNKKKQLLKPELVQLFSQMLAALQYLHGKCIAHRDIKPANILVQSRWPHFHARLADFGLSTDKSILQTYCGTEVYIAPEIAGFGSYTIAVDIWSLAVVIAKYHVGFPSYNFLYSRSLQAEIMRHVNKRAGVNPGDGILYLLGQMLQLDPNRRISAQECSRQLLLAEPSIRQVSAQVKNKRNSPSNPPTSAVVKLKRSITGNSEPESEPNTEGAGSDGLSVSKRRRLQPSSHDTAITVTRTDLLPESIDTDPGSKSSLFSDSASHLYSEDSQNFTTITSRHIPNDIVWKELGGHKADNEGLSQAIFSDLDNSTFVSEEDSNITATYNYTSRKSGEQRNRFSNEDTGSDDLKWAIY